MWRAPNLALFFNAVFLCAGVFKAFAVPKPEMIFSIIQLNANEELYKNSFEIPQTSEELNYSSFCEIRW